MPTKAEAAEYAAILADVAAFVFELPAGVIVVSGGADGVDKAAVRAAVGRGLAFVEHFPNYVVYSREKAPLERNTVIAGDVTELHAWPSRAARGTWDSVNKAKARGVPVTVHKVTT
jgi:hypothetical protein